MKNGRLPLRQILTNLTEDNCQAWWLQNVKHQVGADSDSGSLYMPEKSLAKNPKLVFDDL